MRPPQDLLELPFTFTQRQLLMPQAFLREAQGRGLPRSVFVDELRAFHRLRLLVPMFRVQRNGRLIATLAHRRSSEAWEVGHSHPTGRASLAEARSRSALFDPTKEGFRSRKTVARRAYGVEYDASQYLYSHHQLLMVAMLSNVRPFLRRKHLDGPGARLDVNRWWLEHIRGEAARLHSLVVPLSALEPIYYPEIVGRLRFFPLDYQRYDLWRRRLRLGSMLRWLGVDAAWLKESGVWLLGKAEAIDPMGEWHSLWAKPTPRSGNG